MCSFRDVIVFFSGAEFFHTLSHILIKYYVTLPLQMSTIELTTSMNNWAIIINGVITILLIMWAIRLKKTR